MSDKPSNENTSKVLKTFDMYRFFSRKDVIMVMAFLIGFLIFTLAITFIPQTV